MLTSQAESALKTTLHDETTLRQLVFVYVVVECAMSETLLDQNQYKCNDFHHGFSCHTFIHISEANTGLDLNSKKSPK